MTTIQYTLRSIPPQLDKRLRAKASRSGRSLNAIVLDTLIKAEGLDTSRRPQPYKKLDWFIGGKKLDAAAFDAATREQRAVDPAIWK